jgi:LacI family transcriptional regulator
MSTVADTQGDLATDSHRLSGCSKSLHRGWGKVRNTVRNAVPHVALFVETSLGYGRGILRGISKYVAAHQPWSIFVDQRGLNDPLPDWLVDWNGHGIIMGAQTRQIAEVVANLKIPAVDTQYQFRGLKVPSVIPDPSAIAQAAADHLLERHFRHFAFVGVDCALWSKLRRDAFIEILQRAGFSCHVYSPILRSGLGSWEEGQGNLAEWLHELPKPVGVMAAHDLRALQILDACPRKDIAVPEQVAVIGVDNDETFCNICDPPLSSVKLDLEQMGFTAADLLDRLMHGNKLPKHPVAVKPLGVVTRRSTDIVAVGDSITAQAVRYIHQHACKGASVADVAQHCNVSRRVIERSFSRFLGTSVHEQIVRAKLTSVKQLLIDTDYSLSTIAAMCSLTHASYLGQMFKKEVGQTPGEYRRTISRSRSPFVSGSVNMTGDPSL